MKKLMLTSILLATLAVVFGGMNAFQKIDRFSFISKTGTAANHEMIHVVKYDDCITQEDLPKRHFLFTHQITHQHIEPEYNRVNESARKYSTALDSTLKSLSTVDAHDFIHKTFQDAKNEASREDISEMQRHYQFEIMRMCLDKDKHLNQNTIGRIL
ncbi:hypothetical protein GUA46_05200 [Muricauda sp. HICW]|uniref:Uncharacterized protein n=1 Tax=Flagellimonas chongwuensis TaxID=2697365 RepID=A0A850N913_9FLAO|nr:MULTISPECIES: hypothetical protein [Allomuricauda]NVN17731.1 hypothetical protein [Allomuricauda chongwuensis]